MCEFNKGISILLSRLYLKLKMNLHVSRGMIRAISAQVVIEWRYQFRQVVIKVLYSVELSYATDSVAIKVRVL